MTDKTQAALRLALEALDRTESEPGGIAWEREAEAIIAIHEALADHFPAATKMMEPKQKQEPLGYLYELIVEGQVVNEKFTSVNWDTRYEPFGRNGVDHGGKVTKTPLCTSPASKPWVGLTDEEIKECFKITPDQFLPWHIYQRIEAKLKKKNT